jgi:glycosyltransferase involved in cell wall biosynthesis
MEAIMLSVIMPVYNSGLYLKEAISSILNQTFKDFELLIINDGSTDNSDEIIQEFLKYESRIKYISRKNNKKIVFTLNEGLSLAKGKFIARMDADDIAHPERFYKQIDYLSKNTEISVLGTGFTPFSNNENNKKAIIFNYPPIFMAYKLISNTFLCHPTVMIKKNVLAGGGYVDNEAEDFELFSRLSRKFKCTILPESLLQYREHNTNRTIEFKEDINKCVKNTFEANYQFYSENLLFIERYYDFHVNLKGNIFFFPIYIYLSMTFFNKIRFNYNVSLYAYEFWYSIYCFYKELFNRIISRFVSGIKNVLKS